jgi:Protein of unknown function (DUF4058)
MPVHNWTRVSAGTFHDFHCTWIPQLKNRLNEGVLPPEYYAQVEQVSGEIIPDVLTLRAEPAFEPLDTANDSGGIATAVAAVPPKVRFTAELELDTYASLAREVVIRHSSNDRIIALVEVLCPGNKSSQAAFQALLTKATAALRQGCHLLLIDLLPPGPRDPQGIHGAIWSELGDDSYASPPEKPLTLVAYSAGPTKKAYIEPFAVGDTLTAMPLFLSASTYVLMPLEDTYQEAYRGVPRRWREILRSPR